MTGPARLQALRLQGFKSFAERTIVEFVPGINAIVGPNGSGKSNLADALRWTLGEQGRVLRSRRAEDVVFAGSDRRAALGMADVTLVLDNSDGLVPVDFAVLEVGRRLFRSGENDYLVNRQRVRLKDLVELLDAAHLADNAFLFIGQGMVDQALALRPEERRPLFEEVAGVRRHERRRRRAEEQLDEASANLARVEDILAELRPQVRRLAAQAEQQASRARAGDDLAAALVATFGGRWHVAERGARDAEARLAGARRTAAATLETLQAAENRAAAAAGELAARVAVEAERRAAHEAARATLAVLDLEGATAAAEASAIERDRDRLAVERAAAEADLGERRRELALPVPALDPALDGELAEADRALAEARAEAGALRAATTRRSEAEAALRRAAAARADELAALRRRLAAAAEARAEAASARASAEARAEATAGAVEAAHAVLGGARAAEDAARGRREAARLALADAEAARHASVEAAATVRARVALLRGRADAMRARLAADEGRGIAPAARRAGGRAIAGDLEVEPSLRPLVAAALGELGRSFVVPRAALARLAGERGVVVLGDAAGSGARAPVPAEVEAARRGAANHGGGLLADGVRADPTGVARRLLARWAWAPSLADAVDLAAALPAGWRVAWRGGGIAGADGVVALGAPDAPLERRAELDGVALDLAAAEAEAAAVMERMDAAESTTAAARAEAEAARRAEGEAVARRRTADEAERQAGRAAEHAAREAAWSAAREVALDRRASPAAGATRRARDRGAALGHRRGRAGRGRRRGGAGGVGEPGHRAGGTPGVPGRDPRRPGRGKVDRRGTPRACRGGGADRRGAHRARGRRGRAACRPRVPGSRRRARRATSRGQRSPPARRPRGRRSTRCASRTLPVVTRSALQRPTWRPRGRRSVAPRRPTASPKSTSWRRDSASRPCANMPWSSSPASGPWVSAPWTRPPSRT